ncbi:MAG: GNAT family N-acetyltransferase [Lachnospiraceae bacterium]|nr:GNAT family N-acetyltransferase [Lachnospiraceae bacterium]
MITLQKVTKENLDDVLSLTVDGSQKSYVSSNAESLAQAYVYSETAYPFAVYDDETVVGFIMMGYYEAKEYYTLWKFMIDKKHQHKGCGRKALELGIQFIKDKFDAKEVYTGVVPGNDAAKNLYKLIGFKDTGLVELGMEEMRLVL